MNINSRYAFVGAISALVMSPTLVSASLDSNLRYGNRGQQVTELQEFLIAKNFLHGQATGNFYALTRKAVVAYQTANEITPSGFVGPITRQKINAELALGDTSSTQAELTETGTSSAPTATANPVLDQLVKQLALLQKQLDEQKKSQQLLTQIAANTTPASPAQLPTPNPPPTPARTPSPTPSTIPTPNTQPVSNTKVFVERVASGVVSPVVVGGKEESFRFRTTEGVATLTEVSLKTTGTAAVEKFALFSGGGVLPYTEMGASGGSNAVATFSELSMPVTVGSPGAFGQTVSGSWIQGLDIRGSFYSQHPEFGQTVGGVILDGYKYRTSDGREVVVTDDYGDSTTSYIYPLVPRVILTPNDWKSLLLPETRSFTLDIQSNPEVSSLSWRKLVINVSRTGSYSLSNLFLRSPREGTVVPGANVSVVGNQIVILATEPLPKGSYTVVFDVVGSVASGDSLYVSLQGSGVGFAPPAEFDSVMGTASAFVWSDGTGGWLNDFGVTFPSDGLPSTR